MEDYETDDRKALRYIVRLIESDGDPKAINNMTPHRLNGTVAGIYAACAEALAKPSMPRESPLTPVGEEFGQFVREFPDDTQRAAVRALGRAIGRDWPYLSHGVIAWLARIVEVEKRREEAWRRVREVFDGEPQPSNGEDAEYWSTWMAEELNPVLAAHQAQVREADEVPKRIREEIHLAYGLVHGD